MRLGPSAPRAWGPWQKAQFEAKMGAPRFAAAASGAGPRPRNSRTACAPRGGPLGAFAAGPGGAAMGGGGDALAGRSGGGAASLADASTGLARGRDAHIAPAINTRNMLLTLAGMALLRRPAAINDNVGAGGEPCRLGAQETRKRSDLMHLAPSAHGQVRQELPVGVWIIHYHCIQLCAKRP